MRAVRASASRVVVIGGATPARLSRGRRAFSVIQARVSTKPVGRASVISMSSRVALPAASAAFAVGSLFDSAVGGAIAAVLGGVVATLAERLWSKRHLSSLELTHSDAPGNAALLNACPHFSKQYDAVDALRNKHACTIVVSLFRSDLKITYQREVLRMPDGGHVTLDWPIDEIETATGDATGDETDEGINRSAAQATDSSSAPTETNDEFVAETIRQLQFGNDDDTVGAVGAFTSQPPTRSEPHLGSAGPDGVPGKIGVCGGGGVDGCGSGGGGCDLGDREKFASITGPHRRSIPDQGATVLRKRLAAHWRTLPDDAPVLVLMSGIAGGSHDKYLKHFLNRARRMGYRCVAFNCRGTANSPLTTPQFYSASFTGDIRNVVDELHTRWPSSKLFAVGWSLGANILTNFLGEEGGECKLHGAVAMCNPFDLNKCDDALNGGGFFGTVYSRAMATNMRSLFQPHEHLFAGLPQYDCELVAAAKSVRDFDEAVTRVTFGFPSVDTYYAESSSRHIIQHVKRPLLVVQAKDDPIAVRSSVPRDAIRNMTATGANTILVETEHGGHLGWSAGCEAPFGAPWPDIGAMQFLEAVRKGTHLEGSRGAGEAAAVREVEAPAPAR
jgi:predicted alpha/beta-fold hydrolase|tara:strand:- start:2017 stop:3864 length:1848 start_codon:yes stop_codon:yes gene_type:complete